MAKSCNKWHLYLPIWQISVQFI